MSQNKRCGYIGLVGRPNVGKSTLLNRLLGQKLSITSRKPQTTRHSILGIKTTDTSQYIFVDTPGLHKAKKALNKYMNRSALTSMKDVDVVLFLVEWHRWLEEEDWICKQLADVKSPVVLIINKVDRCEDKAELLPKIEELAATKQFAEIVPLSAKQGDNVAELEAVIDKYLPESEHFYYEPEQVSDRPDSFFMAELIREQLIKNLGEELPYATTVTIEEFKRKGNMIEVNALIWVEKEGQRPIILGKGGERLKKIATNARKGMEKWLDSKVHLNVWIKIRGSWSDDENALRSLGYSE